MYAKKHLLRAVLALAAFILWTAALCVVDVKPIGPQDTAVGFAAINGGFHKLTGVHMDLYTLTDWLGLIPFGFMAGFALLGLMQWIKGKHIARVDRSILILGIFYAVVLAAYLFFEIVVINHRPVLIEGRLEASYPSSTTMLVLCVMPTALMQLKARCTSSRLFPCLRLLIIAFTVFMVVARLISGVHWFSDILGGVLLSSGLVQLYRTFA